MTAQPIHDSPNDPVEILRLLPDEYHSQFLDDCNHALDAAQRPGEFRALEEMLHLWRLRAVAYSSPGYPERLEAASNGDAAESVPAEQMVRGWPTK